MSETDHSDRLVAEELRASLGDCRIGNQLVVVEETASTNDLVWEAETKGATEGFVVFAERQRAGRGRYGRRWESAPYHGLWFSVLLRPALKMSESPLFAKLKSEGKTSINPIKESFGHRLNFKMVLLALFGATMGQGVIWYTGQFYAQSFLLTKCFIDYEQANTIILIALVLATPFFIVFGSLSDRWGRKHIMMIGMLLGVLLYRPIFHQLLRLSDTSGKVVAAQSIKVEPSKIFTAASDSTTTKKFDDGSELKITSKANSKGEQETKKVLLLDGSTRWKMIFLIAIMVLFVTMVYGPIAAFLVEMFPTKIRYTSMSLPYHIGNGIFGGLVPFIATLITTIPGSNALSGLWYPIIVAALCFVIGSLYLSNKMDEDVTD